MAQQTHRFSTHGFEALHRRPFNRYLTDRAPEFHYQPIAKFSSRSPRTTAQTLLQRNKSCEGQLQTFARARISSFDKREQSKKPQFICNPKNKNKLTELERSGFYQTFQGKQPSVKQNEASYSKSQQEFRQHSGAKLSRQPLAPVQSHCRLQMSPGEPGRVNKYKELLQKRADCSKKVETVLSRRIEKDLSHLIEETLSYHTSMMHSLAKEQPGEPREVLFSEDRRDDEEEQGLEPSASAAYRLQLNKYLYKSKTLIE